MDSIKQVSDIRKSSRNELKFSSNNETHTQKKNGVITVKARKKRVWKQLSFLRTEGKT